MSNFYRDRLVDLIENNDVRPAVNQIETHPFFQRHTDQELMRARGVQMESWGPFAEGRNNLFSNPMLADIGAAHGKSVAQVVLRWLIQRNVVVIPKSVRANRMAENFDVFDFTLNDDEMARIAAWTGAPPPSSTTATPRSPAASAGCGRPDRWRSPQSEPAAPRRTPPPPPSTSNDDDAEITAPADAVEMHGARYPEEREEDRTVTTTWTSDELDRLSGAR